MSYRLNETLARDEIKSAIATRLRTTGFMVEVQEIVMDALASEGQLIDTETHAQVTTVIEGMLTKLEGEVSKL